MTKGMYKAGDIRPDGLLKIKKLRERDALMNRGNNKDALIAELVGALKKIRDESRKADTNQMAIQRIALDGLSNAAEIGYGKE